MQCHLVKDRKWKIFIPPRLKAVKLRLTNEKDTRHSVTDALVSFSLCYEVLSPVSPIPNGTGFCCEKTYATRYMKLTADCDFSRIMKTWKEKGI